MPSRSWCFIFFSFPSFVESLPPAHWNATIACRFIREQFSGCQHNTSRMTCDGISRNRHMRMKIVTAIEYRHHTHRHRKSRIKYVIHEKQILHCAMFQYIYRYRKQNWIMCNVCTILCIVMKAKQKCRSHWGNFLGVGSGLAVAGVCAWQQCCAWLHVLTLK